MNAWADRIIGVWDMTSDFSDYLRKVGVKLGFVFLIIDGHPTLFAHPGLSQKSIEGILKILGKKAPFYSKRAFEVSQSAPAYSAIKQIDRMMAENGKP